MKEIHFNIKLFKWVNLIATFFIIIGVGAFSSYWVIAVVAGAVWFTFISLIIAVCNLLVKIYEVLISIKKNE
jgi:hypothetical protein